MRNLGIGLPERDGDRYDTDRLIAHCVEKRAFILACVIKWQFGWGEEIQAKIHPAYAEWMSICPELFAGIDESILAKCYKRWFTEPAWDGPDDPRLAVEQQATPNMVSFMGWRRPEEIRLESFFGDDDFDLWADASEVPRA